MSAPSNPSESSNLIRHEIFTIAALSFVNIVNYMDRYSVAAVLIDIQADFAIGDDLGGLLQSGFIFSYMIFSPPFGYLGDRYSRKLLLIICIVFWTLMTISGSRAPNYPIFFATRALVGVGEAGFTTIAPTVISDIVSKDARSTALMIFYIAIPVGSGMGYLVSAKVAQYMGGWRWGLRATPLLGIVGAVLLIFGVDPNRGEKEAAEVGGRPPETTTYTEDLRDLVRNPSYMLSTCAFTCVCFITGTVGWWAPKCIYYGFSLIVDNVELVLGDVVFKFGAITALTGLFGVGIGSSLSKYLRRYWPFVDPIICGMGLLISFPLLVGAFLTCVSNEMLTFVLIFFGQLTLNLNWAIVADILLYVIIPTRRASAEAIQMLVSHALGDCFSPYIVGLMSEYLKNNFIFENDHSPFPSGSSDGKKPPETDHQIFHALQLSLLIVMLLQVVGAVMFLINARYIVEDRKKAEEILLET